MAKIFLEYPRGYHYIIDVRFSKVFISAKNIIDLSLNVDYRSFIAHHYYIKDLLTAVSYDRLLIAIAGINTPVIKE